MIAYVPPISTPAAVVAARPERPCKWTFLAHKRCAPKRIQSNFVYVITVDPVTGQVICKKVYLDSRA